jgi:hypothetical protein
MLQHRDEKAGGDLPRRKWTDGPYIYHAINLPLLGIYIVYSNMN